MFKDILQLYDHESYFEYFVELIVDSRTITQ